MTNIILPSNPKDQIKIKQMISQCVDCLERIAGENEAKKEIIDEISEQFDIPKKLVNKIIRIQHKLNFSEVQVESEDTEALYDTLYGTEEDSD